MSTTSILAPGENVKYMERRGGNASLIKCPPFHAKGIFSLFHPLGFYSNFSGWKLALRIGKNVKNIESIMHAGRWSKEDTVIKDFIVEISSDSSLCTSKNAKLLGVDRRTLSNYTRNY